METELLKSFLLWSAALNNGLLLLSFAILVFARDWMYLANHKFQ